LHQFILSPGNDRTMGDRAVHPDYRARICARNSHVRHGSRRLCTVGDFVPEYPRHVLGMAPTRRCPLAVARA
jgi:hypothetical protein